MNNIRQQVIERAAEKLLDRISKYPMDAGLLRTATQLQSLVPQPQAEVQANLVPQITLAQEELPTLDPSDLLETDANFLGLAPGTLADRHLISRDSAKGVVQGFLFAAAYHGRGQTPHVMRGLENCISLIQVDGESQVSFDANLLDFAMRNVFRESRTLANTFKASYLRTGILYALSRDRYRGLPNLTCWAQVISDKTIIFVEPRDFFSEADATQNLLPAWACPQGPVNT